MISSFNDNDKDLMRRFSSGEEAAFQELIDKYKNSLYSFLRRFLNQNDLVEDVFQETFIQLYISKNSFDLERPLRPWLFTIAANKARDVLRRIQRANETNVGPMADAGDVSIDDVFNSITSEKTTPYDEIEKQETQRLVQGIISEMPDNLREILIFAYFEQFSYKHIAEILSIPIGTVKSRLHTAVVYFSKKWKLLNQK
jgi:RNA polymerase sigma-70 factor (ECF subfamily)